MSIEKSKLIHNLLIKALDIVSSNATDKNTENFADLIKNSTALARHRSLENLKGEASNQDSAKHATNNRQIYSPHTSSPIPQSICTKQDSEKGAKLMEAIKAAHKLLSDALDVAANQNTTFTKRARRISDLKISPLSVDDQTSGSCNSFNLSKPDSSCCKTPKKPKTPKKVMAGIGDKKKLLLPPSKLGLLRPNRRSDSAILMDNLPASKKVSPFMKDKSLKLNLSGVKSKIGVKNDTPTRLKIPSKIATFTSTKTPRKN